MQLTNILFIKILIVLTINSNILSNGQNARDVPGSANDFGQIFNKSAITLYKTTPAPTSNITSTTTPEFYTTPAPTSNITSTTTPAPTTYTTSITSPTSNFTPTTTPLPTTYTTPAPSSNITSTTTHAPTSYTTSTTAPTSNITATTTPAPTTYTTSITEPTSNITATTTPVPTSYTTPVPSSNITLTTAPAPTTYTTPAPSSNITFTTAPAPTSYTTPVPSSNITLTTTPVPTSYTTPVPSSNITLTTAPAPTTYTTPAPSSNITFTTTLVPVTYTTPAPSNNITFTTTPAPTTYTTPVPSSNITLTTAPAPTSYRTPASSSNITLTTEPAPTTYTAPAPSSNIALTTAPAPATHTTLAPSSNITLTTAPAPTTYTSSITTPPPTSNITSTTTPVHTNRNMVITSPAPTYDDTFTSTPVSASTKYPTLASEMNTTDPCEGYQVVDVIETLNRTFDTVKVRWNQKNNTQCILEYKISWKQIGPTVSPDESWESLPSITYEYVIRDLVPCTTYAVHLEAVLVSRKAKVTVQVADVIVSTLSKVGRISNLDISAINSTTERVTFKNPENNNCQHSYLYSWNKFKNFLTGPDTVVTNNVSFILNDLLACTAYRLSVTPMLMNENGSMVHGHVVLANFTTQFAVPSQPSNFVTTLVTTDSIGVSWNKPILNAACVAFFNVTIKETSSSHPEDSFITNETEHTFENLEPCTHYVLTLKVVDHQNKTIEQYLKVDGTTDVMSPGPVLNLEILQIDNGFNISWDPPAVSLACVQSYQVYVMEFDETCSSSNTSSTELGVHTSVSEDYKFVPTESHPTNTLKNSSLYQLKGDFLDKSNDNTCNKEIPNIGNVSHQGNTRHFFVIDGLVSCLGYEIEVAPMDNITQGEAITTRQRTKLSQMGPVRNINAEPDIKVITVKWDEPIESPKCIKAYIITWNALPNFRRKKTISSHSDSDEDDTLIGRNSSFANSGDGVGSQQVDYDIYEFEIGPVSPCIDYEITIRAVYEDENGNLINGPDETTQSRTLEEIPDNVRDLSFSKGPYEVTATWTTPRLGVTCIRHYRITMWITNTSVVDIEEPSLHTTVQNLKACTNYHFQIIPVTWDYNDSKSPTIANFRTTQDVPTPPTEPALLHVGKYDIALNASTTHARTNKCQVKAYRMMCIVDATKNDPEADWIIESGATTVTQDEINRITNGGDCNSTDTRNRGKTTTLTPTSCDTTHKNVWFDLSVGNLSPFTNYSCAASVENVAGWSRDGEEIAVMTFEDVPSKPTIYATNTTHSSITISWKKPNKIPGFLQPYRWKVERLKPLYDVPALTVCPLGPFSRTEDEEGNFIHLSDEKDGIIPFCEYRITLKAQTNAGYSVEEVVTVKTTPSASENVRLLRIEDMSEPTETYDVRTFIRWAMPCRSNGVISHFVISLVGDRATFDTHYETYNVAYSTYQGLANASKFLDLSQEVRTFEKQTGYLRPDYVYTVFVSAKVVNVDAMGTISQATFRSPSGIPPQLEDIESVVTKVDPDESLDPTKQITVSLNYGFNDSMGDILYFALIVSEQRCADEPRSGVVHTDRGEWPDMNTWGDVNKEDCIKPYQATPVRWNPFQSRHRTKNSISFVLGDNDCEDKTSEYCNGPLRPGTDYVLIVRALTRSGFRDYEHTNFKTVAQLSVALIVGCILAILALGIGIVMLMLFRSGKIPWIHSLRKSGPVSPIPQAVAIKKFPNYVKQLQDNPSRLNSEFQLLQSLSLDLPLGFSAAKLPANKSKNRYVNVLPYDTTRVKLDMYGNDISTDYINASFVKGYSGDVEYIATQGPKEETMLDFWRMILQYDASLIIMVTQLVENGKLKCHQYYPDLRQTIQVGNYLIYCCMEIPLGIYTSRTFMVQNETTQKTITQLHFNEWTDFGCPSSTEVMVQFCDMMHQQANNNNMNKGPIVIHCSAGVGRTGTLIALDILLQHIRNNRKVDVFGTVYELRKQRCNMVQSETQYAYLYSCIKDALEDPALIHVKDKSNRSSNEPIYENINTLRQCAINGSWKGKQSITRTSESTL